MNYKNEIAKKISAITNVNVNDLEGYIETPPNPEMGDFAFPCFKLAKELKKAPPAIAAELKEQLTTDEVIERIDVAGGYLNFFISKDGLVKNVDRFPRNFRTIISNGENRICPLFDNGLKDKATITETFIGTKSSFDSIIEYLIQDKNYLNWLKFITSTN
jgi:hypothetical protein